MASSMAYMSMNMTLASYMEGPMPEFVSLDDKYICVCCKKLLKQPQQTSCGHRICAACVNNMLKDQSSVMCPGEDEFCEQIAKDCVYPDMATTREMSRLKVYCPFKSYGCKHEAIWSKLKEHKEACEYAVEDCQHREFGCTEMVPCKQLDKHQKQCAYRPKTCAYCGLDVATCKMEHHTSQECERAPIPCPYKCGEQSIIRGELSEHKKVCRAKPQECRFKDAGCTYMGSHSDVIAHQENVNVHLDLLHTRHVEDQAVVTALKSKVMRMEDIVESTKRELTKSPNDRVTLEKKIQFLENKVNKLEITLATTTHETISNEEKAVLQDSSFSSQEKKLLDITTRQNSHDRKITQIESNAGSSIDLTAKVLQLERTLGIADSRIAEMDQRFQHNESTSFDGTLVWKISDYMRRKQEAVSGRNVSLYSQPFYNSRFGHKMCMRVYLNGDGIGRGTHMSLFFVLMRGEFDPLQRWPFSQKVTLTLMDQERGIKPLSDMFRPDPSSSSFARPRTDMNIASGCPLFVSHTQLESSSFLRDNALYIKCVVGETDHTGL